METREVSVSWIGRRVGFHPWIIALMPATGLSTSSILLIGQLIDRDADETGGKWGVAVRRGTKFTSRLYLLVQAMIILNVLACALLIDIGWPVLAALPPPIPQSMAHRP